MSTVRVYKSTDPGAPAHPSDVRGSMAALIRACLVTGYGSGDFTAEPAGWEEPYPETNNYACFRALQGTSRFFYQINDNQSAADVTIMTVFESMSDAATGIGGCGANYFGKQHPNAYRNFGWQVIADEKTCYVNLSSWAGSVSHGFGEFFSFKDADDRKAFMAGHSHSSNMAPYSQFAMQSSSASYVKAASSLTSATPINTVMNIGSSDSVDDRTLNGTNYVFAPPAGVSYLVNKGYMRENYNTRGYLRGVYYPLAYKPKTHLEEFTHDGKTFLAIDSGGVTNDTQYLGQIWFDITGSWEESV